MGASNLAGGLEGGDEAVVTVPADAVPADAVPADAVPADSATGISHHWALGTGNLLPELRATAELLGIELAEVAAPARNEDL